MVESSATLISTHAHTTISPAGNATVDEAFKKLKLKKQKECVPGMRVSLMPHQLIGVAWMVEYVPNFCDVRSLELRPSDRAVKRRPARTTAASWLTRWAWARRFKPSPLCAPIRPRIQRRSPI